MDSEREIETLLYRYAECVDTADYVGIGEILGHATVRSDKLDTVLTGADTIASYYRGVTRRHEDGTLRTKHVTTNAIIEVDDAAGTAAARSYYTVLQATDRLPLQPIIAGRYHDRFERVDGRWVFSDRLMIVDLIGDLSEHMTTSLDGGIRASDVLS